MTVLADMGSVDRAMKVATHVLAASPPLPARASIHLAMARAAVSVGRWADAVASNALSVAERDDDHALACEALLVLGRCARDRGLAGAAIAFDRVIDIARDYNVPTLGLRGLMERGSLDAWQFISRMRLVAARDQSADAGAGSV